MEIRLEPTVAICIETTAQREYKRVLNALLKEDQEDRRLEEELELLKLFLESADFGHLRSISEKVLLEGRRVECILKSSKNSPGYELEVNEL